MTLEDDVESMLSEQFNASNESMFRVRAGLGALGGGGDSTYRACEDSVFGLDEDRAHISESEDGGWYASEKDAPHNPIQGEKEDEFSDISEHSSDDVSDSDPEEGNPDGGGEKKKTKKNKGEKGEKKKRKKKKLEGDPHPPNPAQPSQQPASKQDFRSPLVQTYKKLAEETKEGGGGGGGKKEKKNEGNKAAGKQGDNSKSNKKKQETQQIKVNIQTKKNEKEGAANNQRGTSQNNVLKGNKVEKAKENVKQAAHNTH